MEEHSLLYDLGQGLKFLALMSWHVAKLAVLSPKKCCLFGKAMMNWKRSYYRAQKVARTKRQFVAYTKRDHKIPFRPSAVIPYVNMYLHAAIVASRVANRITVDEMKRVVKAFDAFNSIAEPAFTEYPVRMPRFKDHSSVILSTVQLVDDPFNLCPSAHIGCAVLLHNVSKYFLDAPDSDKKVWRIVEKGTKDIINATLYTKQHVLMDISFGILAGRRAYEQVFPEFPFDDMIDDMQSWKAEHPDIDYGLIKDIYEEACLLESKHKSIHSAVGAYLQSRGFPQIEPHEPDIMFDEDARLRVPLTDQKKSVRLSDTL